MKGNNERKKQQGSIWGDQSPPIHTHTLPTPHPTPLLCAPDRETSGVWAVKVMVDTCFPSHLPTSSWVAGGVEGLSPPHSVAQSSYVHFLPLVIKKRGRRKKKSLQKRVKRPSLYMRLGKKFLRWRKGMHAFETEKKLLCFKALFEQHTQRWACPTLEPNNYATFVILTAALHSCLMTPVTCCLHGPTCEYWREFAPLWRKIAPHCLSEWPASACLQNQTD